MKKSDQTTKENSGRASLRHAYAKPDLRVFGAVGNLTQSGSAGEQEGADMMNGPMFMI